jgi:hypothetical protein
VDPHGLIEDVSFSISEHEDDDFIKTGIFEIIFAKPMAKSDVIVRSWDEGRRSMDVFIRDAIEVIPSKSFQESIVVEGIAELEPEAFESEIIKESSTEIAASVPEWVKSNAGWWGKGQINDETFANGIGFLIQNHIIDVPDLMQPNMSPEIKSDDLSEDISNSQSEPLFSTVVPDWIKNTALWWSEGNLSDDDFLNGIKYLLENGVIRVRV